MRLFVSRFNRSVRALFSRERGWEIVVFHNLPFTKLVIDIWGEIYRNYL